MITTRPAHARLRVRFDGELIADTSDALALEEGNYPSVYYVPRKDVKMERLKGHATYCSISNGRQTARNAVWSYETPIESVGAIRELLAFYPDRVAIEIGGGATG